MSERKQVTVQVRPDRSVYVDGVLRRAGDEFKTTETEARSLVDQRIAEFPDAPLDADEVAAAERQRADLESTEHRYAIAVRMDEGMRNAQAREAQRAEDEEERTRNALDHHLAQVREDMASATAGHAPRVSVGRAEGDD